MHYKCFNVKIILMLWAFNLRTHAVQCSDDACWNNENECNIETELFENLELSKNGISLEIDCRLTMAVNGEDQAYKEDINFQISANNLLPSRFVGVQSVVLDGCQTQLNARTFGLELLPICANVTKAAIRHFHMETLKPLYCGKAAQQMQLTYLVIQFNEITFIDADSFSSSNTQLRDIFLERNLLKIIYKDAFKATSLLQNLFIVNEPMLMLKFPDLFQDSSIVSIHLDTLKQMMSDTFKHLPETLQNLYVANTQLDDDSVLVRNSLVLRNLTIKNCAVRNFTLRDVHSTVKHIDLSFNVMKTFTAYENNIKELNLGNNQLESLQLKWLENLTNLEYLILKENRIKTLSLNELLGAAPSAKLLDFSQNRLQRLLDYENKMQEVQLSQVRLSCDQNPWDCLWLHEFAHYHPEKFRILQYKKFISKINVNGLECMPAEKATKPANNNQFKTNPRKPVDRIVNVTAYALMYGSPWEIKRNQRAEALIIVFMLPLGIAFLFVLLYLWIYCQKMFHLSYYQNFPCLRSPGSHTSQRFDIIRQIPPRANQTQPRRPLSRIIDENEEGYEIPINGIISECNCVLRQNDEESDKCQKSVHITYEHLPNEEPPHQIYEEIIQLDCATESSTANNKSGQIYDHLSFE